jgi:hypothetical protein
MIAVAVFIRLAFLVGHFFHIAGYQVVAVFGLFVLVAELLQLVVGRNDLFDVLCGS